MVSGRAGPSPGRARRRPRPGRSAPWPPADLGGGCGLGHGTRSEGGQDIAGPYGVTDGDPELADGPVDLGGHDVLHLHRLDDHQGRAGRHGGPGPDGDAHHSALEGRHHVVQAADANHPLRGVPPRRWGPGSADLDSLGVLVARDQAVDEGADDPTDDRRTRRTRAARSSHRRPQARLSGGWVHGRFISAMPIRRMRVRHRPMPIGANPAGAWWSVMPRITTRNSAVRTTSAIRAAPMVKPPGELSPKPLAASQLPLVSNPGRPSRIPQRVIEARMAPTTWRPRRGRCPWPATWPSRARWSRPGRSAHRRCGRGRRCR